MSQTQVSYLVETKFEQKESGLFWKTNSKGIQHLLISLESIKKNFVNFVKLPIITSQHLTLT